MVLFWLSFAFTLVAALFVNFGISCVISRTTRDLRDEPISDWKITGPFVYFVIRIELIFTTGAMIEELIMTQFPTFEVPWIPFGGGMLAAILAQMMVIALRPIQVSTPPS